VAAARILSAEGIALGGVRLDSGDLADQARKVRNILDRAGLVQVRIVASGGLDEFQLAQLVAAGAPIDGYGIGTRLDVSSDAPYLDCAYKLQQYAGRPRRKLSVGKATWPGRKQVYRQYSPDGRALHDTLTLEDDTSSHGEPLVECVMRHGQRSGLPPSLTGIRARVAQQLGHLPDELKSLGPAAAYQVEITPQLRELADRMDRERAAQIDM
jgi:nicotinate phosphoribosyltransferase